MGKWTGMSGALAFANAVAVEPQLSADSDDAVNLGLAGFAAGRMFSGVHKGPLHDPAWGLARSLRVLPEERRDEIRPLLRSQMRGVGRGVRQLRGAQRQLIGLATAEPFDGQALEAALARFRNELLASQERSHRALVAVMTALTEAERKQVLESMRRHGPPRHRKSPPPFDDATGPLG